MMSDLDISVQNKILREVEKEYSEILNEYKSELNSVNTKATHLFPEDYILEKDESEIYRALCMLSQSGLRQNQAITSHRPIIGKVIVFFKKLLWKLLDSQLKQTFVGISSCFSYLISNQARLEAELKVLKKKTEDKPLV